jgi:hypothetical protein
MESMSRLLKFGDDTQLRCIETRIDGDASPEWHRTDKRYNGHTDKHPYTGRPLADRHQMS